MTKANPLLEFSSLPFLLPQFDEILPEHFLPAIEKAMRDQLAEVDELLAQESVTVENTLDRLERSGALLSYLENVFFTLAYSNTKPELQQIEATINPMISRHDDSIRQSPELLSRFRTLLEIVESESADEETVRCIRKHIEEFEFSGANLDSERRNRVAAINERLASIETEIDKRLLSELNEKAIQVLDITELAGLSDADLASCREAAAERGLEGYLVTLMNYSGHPMLSKLENSRIRSEILDRTLSKNLGSNENYTGDLIKETLTLRQERAEIFGFDNHADYVVARQTAQKTARVWEMLRAIAPLAVKNALEESEKLRALANNSESNVEFLASDWDYWAERERSRILNLDLNELRNYFELNRVLLDGVFFAAGRLFDLHFQERKDLIGYHADVTVFEVRREDSAVGLFLFDPFARANKQSGAWMHNIVDQSRLLGHRPVVVNNLNVVKPAPEMPCLLSFDEVKTLFHEFGHALHGLLSKVNYPSLSGANVERDFVEFPSQVNEMWMLWPEVLENYARHYETGEKLPQEWGERIIAAAAFNQGYETTHYLGAAMLDLAIHEMPHLIEDLESFEHQVLQREGLDFDLVPIRYRTHYFAHIFAGGYSAGYYGYIWSEVLDADSVEYFKEQGGLSRRSGKRFEDWILSKGGSVDPTELFRNFRGREAKPEFLMRRRGLVKT